MEVPDSLRSCSDASIGATPSAKPSTARRATRSVSNAPVHRMQLRPRSKLVVPQRAQLRHRVLGTSNFWTECFDRVIVDLTDATPALRAPYRAPLVASKVMVVNPTVDGMVPHYERPGMWAVNQTVTRVSLTLLQRFSASS